MKAQSDTIPESFVESNGKTQVNYNIRTVSLTDEKGTRTAYEYDYVEIDGNVTKLKVIDALRKADDESIPFTGVPDTVVQQHSDAKSALYISGLTGLTYSQLDTYITNNITDIVSAKVYLKKLSAVVLTLVKEQMRPG